MVSESDSGLSSTGVVLIILSVFLGVTLLFLVYLWNKIRGLRLDPTAYKSLSGVPANDFEDHSINKRSISGKIESVPPNTLYED